MKIVHYCGSLTRSAGGLFYSVSGLAKSQMALGHEVHVIGGLAGELGEDALQWGDVNLIGLGNERYGFDLRVFRRLRTLKPDVFHVHGIWAASSIYARFANLLGYKVVISPHGMLDPWILQRRPLLKRLHAALLEHPAFNHSLAHALNEDEAMAVRAFRNNKSEPLAVIPNGVDALSVPPADFAEREGTVFIGRLHEKKQVVELLDAWKRHAPDHETLTIAGWGAPDYERKIGEACQAARNVGFIGPIYGTEKDRLLSRSKFFVLPSLSEGLPMAVIQALQAGAIPIITRECNLPEVLNSGIGLSISKDFADFAATLNRAFALEHDEAQAMSLLGQEFSRSLCWNGIARRMIDFYQCGE